MSQDDLASAMRVSRTIVSAWENDRRRPGIDKLGALDDLLAAGGTLASGEGPAPRAEPMPVSDIFRQASATLLEHLSEDTAVDGLPGYGWRRDLDDQHQGLSAYSTAHALKALTVTGAGDWRIDIRRIRDELHRLELPGGGWSALPRSRLARPEVTAVVLSALADVGEKREYLLERLGLLVETLAWRAEGADWARPYVLATSLLEMSRMPVADSNARTFIGDLVASSMVTATGRTWPVVVKVSPLTPSGSSTFHTAASVQALAAWARRLDDDELRDVVAEGRAWLESSADLSLDDEEISVERAEGGVEPLTVKHFVPAWTLRALLVAGSGPQSPAVARALSETLRYFDRGNRLWRWPQSGGSYPVWMTYHGLSALRAWALTQPVG